MRVAHLLAVTLALVAAVSAGTAVLEAGEFEERLKEALYSVRSTQNQTSSGGVRLVNNGYEGLVVAISPDLDEAQASEIINGIKDALTEVSRDLYEATRHRAYFRHIKILLPKTWTNTPFDENPVNENFQDSEVRVDKVNPVYGHQPYAEHVGGCGQPGEYIHITPEYLMNDQHAVPWGSKGKHILHEWAEFRWGVFDEVGYPFDPKYQLFYPRYIFSNGQYSLVQFPNYCANTQLQGDTRDIRNVTHIQPCTYNGGVPDQFCRFVPDPDQPVDSSLMGFFGLDHMHEFCDSAADEKHVHNYEAPNKHNDLCSQRSVWDVMGEHDDFKDGANPPTTDYSNPEFTVLAYGGEEAKFVLVLDYSASMKDFDRILKLKRSVQRWLLYDVADGSSVGIVTFNNVPFMVAGLTVISNSTRQSLANMIHTNVMGQTSIGGGLFFAVTKEELLKNKTLGVIVLVTDGEETTQPFIADVMDLVVASGARVVTVAFGDEADRNLESLAENTGGKTYTVLDEDDGTALDEAFQGSLTYQPPDSLTNIAVKIHESHYSGNSTNYTESFMVDASVGCNLQLRVDANADGHIISPPTLVDPSGTVYQHTLSDAALNLWIIEVDSAQVGQWLWSVELSGEESHTVRATVTAQACDNTGAPIHTRAWMGLESQSGTNGTNNATAPLVVVYAEVKQGSKPVVGAMVRAYVTQPDSTDPAVELDLLDNGQGADTTSGDGIYSRYFTNYTNTGRYAVKAQVWDDGNSFINNGFIVTRRSGTEDSTTSPEYCCGSVVPFNQYTATPTGSFSRSAPGGSIMVREVPDLRMVGPSRVSDLQVISATPTTLDLTWTASGDDMDTGIVYGYEVLLSQNRSHLMEDNFDSTAKAISLLTYEESHDMVELQVPAGMKVTIFLGLEGEDLQVDLAYFVALRAIDDDDNVSPVSNIATTMVNADPSTTPDFNTTNPSTIAPTTPAPTTSDPTTTDGAGITAQSLAAIVVSLVLGLVWRL